MDKRLHTGIRTEDMRAWRSSTRVLVVATRKEISSRVALTFNHPAYREYAELVNQLTDEEYALVEEKIPGSALI